MLGQMVLLEWRSGRGDGVAAMTGVPVASSQFDGTHIYELAVLEGDDGVDWVVGRWR